MGYAKPPITESVIELRFSDSIDFDQIVKRSDKFKRSYPNELKNVEISAEISENGAATKSEQVGLRLLSRDELEILMINRNSFMVSRLAPYTGWEEFSDRFQRDFELFNDRFGRRSFTRVGMRYINRLDIPNNAPDVLRYINVHPHLPDIDGSKSQTFALTSTFKLEGRGLGVTLQSATVESPVPKCTSLIIDIDVFADADLPLRRDMWGAQLNTMREVKNEVFERCITDEARRLFS